MQRMSIMQPEKTTVLLTNDDGYNAKGLTELAKVLHSDPKIDLWVVAPAENKTGSSHAISLRKEISIACKQSSDNLTLIVVDGTPADCVYLAVQKLMCKRPDIIISGINHGANFGSDVYYSGTVGAAREGAIYGILSYAVSHDKDYDANFDYGKLARITKKLVCNSGLWGLDPHEYYNINIPEIVDSDTTLDFKFTDLAQTQWGGNIVLRTKNNNPNLMVATLGNERKVLDEDDQITDFNVVRHQNIFSVTKLHV